MGWFSGKKKLSLEAVASDCASQVIHFSEDGIEFCSQHGFELNSEQRQELIVMNLTAYTVAVLSAANRSPQGRVLADAIQYEVYKQAFKSSAEGTECSAKFCERWPEYIALLPSDEQDAEGNGMRRFTIFSRALGIMDAAVVMYFVMMFAKTMKLVKKFQGEIFENYELVA